MSSHSGSQPFPSLDAAGQALLEAAPGPACVLDVRGGVLAANARLGELLGFPDPSLLVGQSIFGLVSDSLSQEGGRLLDQVAATGRPASFERESKGLILRHRLAPLADQDGRVWAVAVFSEELTASRRAEEALRRERQRQRFLMETLPGFVYLVGQDHSILYANRYFRKYFGPPGKMKCHERILGRDRPCGHCPPAAVFAMEKSWEWEWTNARDGRTFQLFASPMTDVDGSLVVLTLGIDVTARKTAEEALRHARDELEIRVEERTRDLRESESRYRAVVEDQTELLCRFGPDGRLTFVNKAFRRFFGGETAHFLGARFLLDLPSGRTSALAVLAEGLSTDAPVQVREMDLDDPAGGTRWLRWTVRALADDEGGIVEYQAAGRDETARKKAESRYHDLIQALPVVIFVLRRDFSLEFVSAACRETLGFLPQEAMNREGWFLERTAPEDRETVRAALAARFEGGGPGLSLEFRFRHAKGYDLHLLLKTMEPTGRSAGERAVVEGALLDVTERNFLDKVLLQREKLNTLGAISAEIAHEIRNPLAPLGGFARRLAKKYPDAPEAGIILSEAVRLEKLLDRIREYLKPAAVSRKPCLVNALLTFCLDRLSAGPPEDGPDVSLDLDGRLPPISTDADILTQVFLSLINNARERLSREGALSIRSYETGGGVGVDFVLSPRAEELVDQELLLLPFERDERNFGLAVSYRRLKDIGGYLSLIQSESATTFTVLLPKNGDLPPSASGGPGAAGTGGGSGAGYQPSAPGG